MALRDTLLRLKREASEDAVLIHLCDGSVRVFSRTHVMAQLYLARLHAASGVPREHESDVLEALSSATPASRREVEALGDGGFWRDLAPADSRSGPPPDLSE